MGLLDDAIREHLQLKLAHGGDEAEVRRQEQEALGPPRMPGDPAPSAAPASTPEPPAEPAPATDLTDAPPASPSDLVEAAPEEARPAGPEPVVEPPLDDDPAGSRLRRAEPEPWLDDADEPAGQPAAPPSEDVLEETPEFLQETPEHDRLWFEQKPPRGFDFDK